MGARSVVDVSGIQIGAAGFVVIGGPCSVESVEQFEKTAIGVRAAGAAMLRGGIYKLRSSPKSFQGLGEDGLEIAKEVATRVGMPLVSEIVDPRHLEILEDVVDMYQVGTRNMHNYALLKELGKSKRAVLIKRGFAATLDELLLAAEYVVSHGNPNVVLCERGIRSFDRATRNTLDLGAVAWLKANTRLPVVVDPSHGVGIAKLVPPMMWAAAAAGADGLLVEVHPNPIEALSDADQALDFASFSQAMHQLEKVLLALGRPLVRAKNKV